MQPHEQRVIDEREELESKLAKLRIFLHSKVFKTLADFDQSLLMTQANVMANYSEILRLRIERFAKDQK